MQFTGFFNQDMDIISGGFAEAINDYVSDFSLDEARLVAEYFQSVIELNLDDSKLKSFWFDRTYAEWGPDQDMQEFLQELNGMLNAAIRKKATTKE